MSPPTPAASVTVGENVRNFAGTLLTSPGKVASALKTVCNVLHWKGFSFFFLVGWFLTPAMEKPYNLVQEAFGGAVNSNAGQASGDAAPFKPYRKSIFHLVVDHVAQASKIAFSVYVVDAIRMALQALGVTNIPHLAVVPHSYMRVAYMFWVVDRIAACKRHFVAHKTKSDPDNLPSKVQLLNRAADVAIYSTGIFAAMAAVRADMGAAAKGFVALGSFSTLLVSLATQNVASQVVSGLFLDLTNRIHKGDSIRVGNNANGAKVEKLGWLNTEMRGADDVKVVVPNKQLVDKEVSNLSRVKTSQVKQKLEFKYQDIKKLPDLVDSIKDEIKKSCPDVITDGSRPFRVYFDNFGTKLEVTVDVHFNIQPVSERYYENRQEVLLAITRAVEKRNVQFAHA